LPPRSWHQILMVRLHEESAALTLASRLARAHVLAVLSLVLVVPAALVASRRPAVAAVFCGAGAALVGFGGRTTRARLAGGGVTVFPASPLERRTSRPLHEFATAAVETVGEARARRAEARAREFAERSGGASLPTWLRSGASPGTNDHLRRLVLVPRGGGAPLPLTAWVAADDDLEPARAAVEARLGS
jgi:hypothetical protein